MLNPYDRINIFVSIVFFPSRFTKHIADNEEVPLPSNLRTIMRLGIEIPQYNSYFI